MENIMNSTAIPLIAPSNTTTTGFMKNVLMHRINSDLALITNIGISFTNLLSSMNSNSYIIEDILQLVEKYQSEIGKTVFPFENKHSSFPTNDDLVTKIGQELHRLQFKKEKFVKELSLCIAKNAEPHISRELFEIYHFLSWSFSSILLEKFAKQVVQANKRILTEVDIEWIQNHLNKTDGSLQSIYDLKDIKSENYDTRFSPPSIISKLKAIFGVYYSFARDLETFILKKQSQYTPIELANEEYIFAISDKEDRDHFGDPLNSNLDGFIPIYFDCIKKETLEEELDQEKITPAKTVKEKDVNTVKEEPNKPSIDSNLKNGCPSLNQVIDGLMDLEAALYSYSWFKKQMVVVVSHYILMLPESKIDDFNSIFEKHVKFLEKLFKVASSSIFTISEGFNILAKFTEDIKNKALEIMEKKEEAPKSSSKKK